MTKRLIFLGAVIVILMGIFGYSYYHNQQKLKSINSFDTCAAAGFAVMDSYPGRCVTSDKRSFTQDIGNELDYYDEILIENPRPNQKVTSPLEIKGRARGSWFFEAAFSAELFDSNNKSLGKTVILTEEDWMTSDFVPFRGELLFSKSTTDKGTLKLRSANPSGLPENQKELILPVSFMP